MIQLDDVKELIKLFKESDLSTLEYEKDNFRVKIEKKSFPFMPQMSALNNQAQEVNTVKKEEVTVDSANYVICPLVGVFHASLTEGGAPVVKVGDRVKKGDKLCIIEAMKVMNEITSDYDGIIKEILVSDGENGDFGKKLFVIGD